MKKLATATLALVLAASLSACSKTSGSGDTPSSTPAAPSTPATSSATTPGDTMSSATVADDGSTGTATATPTTSATPSASATPVIVDQSTPEAAMTSWLGAMVAGEGKTVCTLMATKGKTIASIPGAAQACGTTITPMLDQIKELGSAFQGLQISGATVQGDNATFQSVTTTPALAADVVSSFKAVRIDGKWYVSQG